MTWDRKQRLEATLHEKIAVIVQQKLNDPRLGFVTVTGIELSKDRRHAKVLYTVLGSEAQLRTTARALADSVGRIQELLSPTLRARVMPELRFVFDESVERESRLNQIMDELAAERASTEATEGADDEGEPSPDGDAAADEVSELRPEASPPGPEGAPPSQGDR